MDPYMAASTAAKTEIELMKSAREELGRTSGYLTTTQAVAVCPVPVTEETLLAYPDWVLPRISKNPGARRRQTWLFDPRDVASLPSVLKLWADAEGDGSVEKFKADRLAALRRRDELALERAYGRAA